MGERSCRFSLPANPAVVARARRQIRGWLSGLGWPEQALADLEYAVSEAVSNAVEHAYRSEPGSGVVEVAGVMEVTAVVEELSDGTRRARVWVRDHGRWRPVPADPGDRQGIGKVALTGASTR